MSPGIYWHHQLATKHFRVLIPFKLLGKCVFLVNSNCCTDTSNYTDKECLNWDRWSTAVCGNSDISCNLRDLILSVKFENRIHCLFVPVNVQIKVFFLVNSNYCTDMSNYTDKEYLNWDWWNRALLGEPNTSRHSPASRTAH